MSDAIALTGATGWLGQSVMAMLEEDAPGRRVNALVLPGEAAGLRERFPQLALHVVEGDVTDASSVSRLLDGTRDGAVIHAAGVIHPARVSDFDRVNAGGTRTMLAGAVTAGVRRFVHISSNSPFGLNPSPDDAFRASEPFNPYMGYGKSKMAAEIAVSGAASDGDFEAIILRPPWFYGPGQPERQAKFLSMVRSGGFPVPGDGSQRRSMVYVPDLAAAAIAATRREGTPGAYWIADPTPYALRDIVLLAQQALTEEGFAVKPGYRKVPGAISSIARRADAVLQSRGRYSAQVHVVGELGTTIACQVGPATEALGWTPGGGLVSGMRAAIRDWTARGLTIA